MGSSTADSEVKRLIINLIAEIRHKISVFKGEAQIIQLLVENNSIDRDKMQISIDSIISEAEHISKVISETEASLQHLTPE